MFDHEYAKECAFSSIDDIRGKRVTVMGLGLNGGGVASALFFAKAGAFVTVTDMKSAEELAPSVNEILSASGIDTSRIRFVLGTHEESDFANADCVIKNPGVKYDGNRFLAVAKSIETDISIFLRFTRAPIIAVTGSKGKSSTVSAIHYGLCKAGFKAFLGGNITVSPLTFLHETTEKTPVVLELSSWQLADLRGRGVLKPFIAVLTTIVRDHQNWYGAMEPYIEDKKLIYRDQMRDCYTVCKYNDSWGSVFAAETVARVIWYAVGGVPPVTERNIGWLAEDGSGKLSLDYGTNGGTETCIQAEAVLPPTLLVPGVHMKENLLKAAIVMRLMGVTAEKTAAILAQYTGIPHRLEFFHTYNGVRFYNDSAATVPESAVAALNAFNEPVILICGGTDKKCDFAPLASALADATQTKHLVALYLLGGTATDLLLPRLNTETNRTVCHEKPFDSLESLLRCLKADLDAETVQAPTAQKEDEIKPVVVFSPGATSFGMFKNEFDRGTQYKTLVKTLFC